MSEDKTEQRGAIVQEFKPPIIPARLGPGENTKEGEYSLSAAAKDTAFRERVKNLKDFIVKNIVNADQVAPEEIERFNQEGEISGTKWPKKRFYDGWKALPNSSLVYVDGRMQTHSRKLQESMADSDEISREHTGAEKMELCYKDKVGKLVRMVLDTSRISGHENWGFAGSLSNIKAEVRELFGENEAGHWANSLVVQAVIDELRLQLPKDEEPL